MPGEKPHLDVGYDRPSAFIATFIRELGSTPDFLSPGWLKIDPNFDPLRKNPIFQELVAGK